MRPQHWLSLWSMNFGICLMSTADTIVDDHTIYAVINTVCVFVSLFGMHYNLKKLDDSTTQP